MSTPSPTTPPATSPSTVPVAGAPVWLELSITADTATKVQVVRYHSSTGEVLDLGAVSTPFTKMVQGRPGREIELTGVLPAGDERVFCQIVIGERLLVRDDGADGRLACRTVIPE
ncbi:MAG: hypothetical protein H3C34_17920 [Caldilineaceae bacterium]|nr:hypothetical protein [Caldilineaceae bacterium]